jgi:hypothetical protein
VASGSGSDTEEREDTERLATETRRHREQGVSVSPWLFILCELRDLRVRDSLANRRGDWSRAKRPGGCIGDFEQQRRIDAEQDRGHDGNAERQ